MKHLIVGVVVMTCAGCQTSVPEAKVEAYNRWHHTRARILYGVAKEHLKGGHLTRAGQKAEQALLLDEDYGDARALLGKVYIELGNYSAAVRELHRAVEENAESAEYAYLLGVAQEKAGRGAEALKSYRQAFALDPNNIAPVLAASEVLVGMGRLREAQLYLESYEDKASHEPGLFELAGRIALMRKEYPKAAECFQQACDLDTRNVRYQEALGQAQFFAGQPHQAAETIKDLLATKDYEGPSWVYTLLGDSSLAAGRTLQARDAYQIANEKSPKDPAVWVNLAEVNLRLGELSQAILAARQARNLQADDLDAAMILGYALLRNGQTEKARAALAEAVSAHPRESMLHCLLGRAHAALGAKAEAVRCYDEALRLDPGNGAARELLQAARGKELSRAGPAPDGAAAGRRSRL